MKIDARSVDRFLRAPDSSVWAVLIYGPDRGLVRDRGVDLLAAWGAAPDDAFAFAALTDDDLKADPLRFADEIDALSLIGGARTVRLRLQSEVSAGPVVSRLLDTDAPPPAARLVIEAGDLKKTSKLRKAAEASPAAAAIACYPDNAQALERLAEEQLAADGLSLSRDARAALAPLIEGDRALARGQIEKLALYMLGGGRTTIEADDVTAACADASAAALYDFADAVASGDAAAADRLLQVSMTAGTAPVALCRALQRQFLRLSAIQTKRADGASLDRAIAMTGPPLYGPARDALNAQVRRWPADALAVALAQTLQAERRLKSTGAPDAALLGRLALALARGPRRAA